MARISQKSCDVRRRPEVKVERGRPQRNPAAKIVITDLRDGSEIPSGN
jgi:hypothetical protein